MIARLYTFQYLNLKEKYLMKIKRILQLTVISLTLSSCAAMLNMMYKISATKADKVFALKGYEMAGDMVCKPERKEVPSQFRPKDYIKCNGTTKDSRRAEYNGGILLEADSNGHKGHFEGLIDGKKVFVDFGEDDL